MAASCVHPQSGCLLAQQKIFAIYNERCKPSATWCNGGFVNEVADECNYLQQWCEHIHGENERGSNIVTGGAKEPSSWNAVPASATPSVKM